jgi:hypothetical protein
MSQGFFVLIQKLRFYLAERLKYGTYIYDKMAIILINNY